MKYKCVKQTHKSMPHCIHLYTHMQISIWNRDKYTEVLKHAKIETGFGIGENGIKK